MKRHGAARRQLQGCDQARARPPGWVAFLSLSPFASPDPTAPPRKWRRRQSAHRRESAGDVDLLQRRDQPVREGKEWQQELALRKDSGLGTTNGKAGISPCENDGMEHDRLQCGGQTMREGRQWQPAMVLREGRGWAAISSKAGSSPCEKEARARDHSVLQFWSRRVREGADAAALSCPSGRLGEPQRGPREGSEMPESAPKSPKIARERSKTAEGPPWTAQKFSPTAPKAPSSPQDSSKRAPARLQASPRKGLQAPNF